MDKLFLGLIFILFDFSLLSINILPDFIGYGFIYLATEEFLRKAYHLRQIRPFVLALGIYDLVIFMNSFLHLPILLGGIRSLVSLVVSLLSIYIIYQIIAGIRDLEAYYRMDLRYLQLYKYYSAIMVMRIISSFLIYIPFTSLIIIGIQLTVMIVSVLFMVEFNRTRILFRNHFLN